MGVPAVRDVSLVPVPTESPRALPDGSGGAGESTVGPPTRGDSELKARGQQQPRAFYRLPAWERRPRPPAHRCPVAQARGSEC